MKWFLPSLFALAAIPSVSLAEPPVFAVVPAGSSITFHAKAARPIHGRFDKWKATLTFTSSDVSTGVLDVAVDVNSVTTGNPIVNGTIKGADFLDVKNNPVITFRSRKISQTGPVNFLVTGDFSIAGVSRPKTLVLTVTGEGTPSGEIKGTMAFDRKTYHIDVAIDLKIRRVSGPPLALNP